MVDAVYVPHQTMVRDVWSVNSPKGYVIVWESLYPEDRNHRDRFIVTVNDCFNRRVLDWFSTCGWFCDVGSSRAEAIAEAKIMQRLAINAACDPERWQRAVARDQ